MEALAELIKGSVQQYPDEGTSSEGNADVPMQEHAGAAVEAEGDGDQTLEQLEEQIAIAANATRAAQQRANEQKAAADLQEQEQAQLLRTPTASAEELLRVEAERAQRAAQVEAAAEAKRQARLVLQAELEKQAEAERLAAAEEQRALSIARGVAEAEAQHERATREAEASAAELAKRVYEAATQGDGGPGDEDLEEKAAKKAREEAAEQTRLGQTERQSDLQNDHEAAKGTSGPGGGKGKGGPAREAAAHPYVQA